MIETRPNTQKFKENIGDVTRMYREAFAGFPWYENLTEEQILKRLLSDMAKVGFESFVAESEDGKIIGGLWFNKLTTETLRAERGDKLLEFAKKICKELGIIDIVWERELMVKPDYQNKKIATRLRMTFLNYLKQQYQNGVLVLTRMRDDNIGTLTIAEKLGYQRSGIRIPSSQDPKIFHEFWYKIIKP